MRAESEHTTGPGFKPPIVLSPWLVALAALALYGLTLHHWVTFASLPFASQLMGWDWHPGPLPWRPAPDYHPLFLVLTFPLRLLPAGWRVGGLNALNAVCAALTLAILARSVRLFPHNHTREQRLRQGAEHALLSMRSAFLPAALAVLLLAGQLTFWENAVSGTGEMIDLLVFAFLILCLLEYRISRSERRLSVLAFVYGLGVANNWALIGFFPCFLAAVIWVKRAGFFNPPAAAAEGAAAPGWVKLNPTSPMSYAAIPLFWLRRLRFFNWRFVLRMTALGVMGLLLYGLIPLLGALHHDGGFWVLMRQQLAGQHIYLKRIPAHYALIAGLPTLLPLFFAGINWRSFEGEMNPAANSLASVLFRMMHLFFLAVGVLMFFDVKYSPSPRSTFGLGVMGGPGFLTFYYLAALSAGYFSGWVLLVFGRDAACRLGQATRSLRSLNAAVVGLLWAAAIGLPGILFYVNSAHIGDFNGPAVADFANEMARSLPAKPAIVVADDPARLYLAMGACQRLGLPDRYVFVESLALTHGEYLRYLAGRYPAFQRELASPDRVPDNITSRQIASLLSHLAARQAVYYLHPSFGSYLELVSMTPRGLGGDLHPCPTNSVAPAPPTPEEIAANQTWWHGLENGSLDLLPVMAKKSGDALRISIYYSQALDYWGTELQKAATELRLTPQLKEAMLKDAGDQFTAALRLNQNNVMARINQQYNLLMRGAPGAGAPIDTTEVAAQCRNHWDVALNLYGPADTPDLEIQLGQYLAERGIWLQGAHCFQRCLELAPNHPVGESDLARCYIELGMEDAALGLIKNMRQHSTINSQELARLESLAYASKNDFAQADKVLAEEHNRNPKDAKFAALMAELYRLMGYSVLRDSLGDPAKEAGAQKEAAIWFRKSLAALDEQLQLLTTPGANAQEISNINLRKAEIQMTMKDFDAAIGTLTALVRQEPDKPLPLLNRAISELQAGRLDAAKSDYHAVEKLLPKPSDLVCYGLAQIAQKQNDTAAEIRYDKLYLDCAPRNTPQYTNTARQLRELESRRTSPH